LIKCLIWDLDETLWSGTLTEHEAVRLRPGMHELLAQLDNLGILQSIASRNDRDQALEQLEEFGISHYFLLSQIGWESKADSVQTIAEGLNIGLDAVAFIDDNPFERGEVASRLPEVTVLAAEEAVRLLELPQFQPPQHTSESSNRRVMTAASLARRTAADEFAGSREAFLHNCRMKLSLRLAQKEDLQRVLELVSRTNQLNNFKEPVAAKQTMQYIADENKRLYIAELEDKFGWHGIVAAAMIDLHATRLEVKLFCISCRVEGRGIGTAFLGAVLNSCQHEDADLREAICCYKPARRNLPALLLLQLLGFIKGEKREDYIHYKCLLPAEFAVPDWIEIIDGGLHGIFKNRN